MPKSKKKPLLSIIITCKDALQFLNKCLTSIEKQTGFKDFEVIFVDDGSKDMSLQFVSDNFSHYRILKNLRNVGFARANNEGVALSRGMYLFILNADTYLEKNTLQKIAQYIKRYPERKFFQLD